jgi:hypothetical protein
MKRGHIISPAEVDFWLDSDKYSNFIEENLDPSNDTLIFSIDMVRLSSIRAAISNFVRILTRQIIPVYFNDDGNNFNVGGKIIYLSAKINSKQDFDCAVGQSLHEAAHTLKSDFDVIKTAWANIPHKIFKMSDSKNIRRASLEKFVHNVCNVIEDRYIDNYVFNEAPGYRGYYVALYDKFWNCPEIDEYLKSDNFRYPSLKSYDFRITNFTNENTDLMALPRLDDIAREVDISHIDRLKTTKDRVEVSFKIIEIVLDCIDKQEKLDSIKIHGQGGKKPKNGLATPSDFFDFGDDEVSNEDDKKDNGSESDVGKKMIDEISNIMNGKGKESDNLNENFKAVGKISNEEDVPKEVDKEISKILENQRKFLQGDIPKEMVTKYQKDLLDLIEKHGIILVRVDLPNVSDGNNLKVDCIVVKKMTKDLILSGKDVFPLCGIMKIGKDIPCPPIEVSKAVTNGVLLGIKLGRKLQIRSELHPVKIIRKKSGKINKRQLHEAAFDAEDLFYKIHIDEHHNANLHITVDASSSMSIGNKWEQTMTAVVAICKAASMVNNIHVTVSFRTTQVSGSAFLPYVVMAYDSDIDKFSKIKHLFPYLLPDGCTPEGLAFGAIMDLFDGITPDEEDRYFLNLSDGEPYYSLNSPETGAHVMYSDDVGVNHTKSQVDKIRQHGVEILSYFIDDSKSLSDTISEEHDIKLDDNPLRKNFRKMYGKNAKFIGVNNVVDLAKTINELFLLKKV